MTTEIPNIYQLTDAGTAPRFNEAFAKGCGGTIVHDGKLRPGPVALWGEHKFFRTLHAAIALGRTWYYGDHAYFGRNQFYRVTKNALQVHGGFFDGGPRFVAALARFDEVCRAIGGINIEPAKPKGDFILICPPSEPLSERSGFTQDRWTKIVVARLRRITKRPIVIRQKPKINRTPAPLLEAMVGAYCLVTFTSNAAIEVTCAGYPALCTGANPANVFSNSFEGLERDKMYVADETSRTAWAGMLCLNQWTLAEIAAGETWKAIQ